MSELLIMPRIFEIPQVPPEVIAGLIAQAVGLASEHTRRNYRTDIADFEAWRKGRQVTRGLVEEYLQFRGGAGADHEFVAHVPPAHPGCAALVDSLHPGNKSRRRRSNRTLWPWKYELLSQLDLAAQVKGPARPTQGGGTGWAGISRMKKPLASWRHVCGTLTRKARGA